MKKIAQILLLVSGIALFVVTYFIYPKSKNETFVQNEKELEIEDNQTDKDTSFTNIEYKGFTSEGGAYIVQAEKGRIEKDNTDLVYMINIIAKYYFKDGRIIVITSNAGEFNKLNGDISFQKNIKMVDSDENKLTAENLDMLISKNYATAYNNVKVFTNNGQFLITDKIFFDAQKKTFKISMFEKKEKVKMKLIK